MKHKNIKRIKQQITKVSSKNEKKEQHRSEIEIKHTKIIGGSVFTTFFISWFFSGFGTTMMHELLGDYLIQVYCVVISIPFILAILNFKLIIIKVKILIK